MYVCVLRTVGDTKCLTSTPRCLLACSMDSEDAEATDYRKITRASSMPFVHHPLGAETTEYMDAVFERLSSEHHVEEAVSTGVELPVMMGRTLHIDAARGAVARASFQQLCDSALGAADYMALAEHYHTIVLDDIPAFVATSGNILRRFITRECIKVLPVSITVHIVLIIIVGMYVCVHVCGVLSHRYTLRAELPFGVLCCCASG
jgi:hypothetical protein